MNPHRTAARFACAATGLSALFAWIFNPTLAVLCALSSIGCAVMSVTSRRAALWLIPIGLLTGAIAYYVFTVDPHG